MELVALTHHSQKSPEKSRAVRVLDREKLEPIFALPQKNEFIADHGIWRRRTCFELWIFYSSRTLNVSAHSSDWNDGWISSGPTCSEARKIIS
jgi:hypothetical protein